MFPKIFFYQIFRRRNEIELTARATLYFSSVPSLQQLASARLLLLSIFSQKMILR